ncbi:DUF4112 domain-containing protein [Pelagicoccus sp. SDUM812002]|uniref:DUF4112 domain-containing protein n=1 Tax=Pelagicoccus sp. SDUM812002 TaxID=3041266 RepID=UPI00280E3B3A|nr:DUF4112 domain-containing protein [Pelagicoccus sp. SDUM812002]MDQ8184676.1 DUF4112 domain-containing protein [Pelagicoccus sp. SDUM812002]
MPTQLETDLKNADRVATVMDSAFQIPGTTIRIGWDALIGLIPGAGDTLAALPLAYFLFIGWRHKLPKHLLMLMVGRQLLDLLIGSIPLLGDLFDVAYRANQKNARTLRDALANHASLSKS